MDGSTIQLQYNAVQYSTVQYTKYTGTHWLKLTNFNWWYTVLQYSTVYYSIVQYSKVHYSIVQYNTVSTVITVSIVQ